ncbi:PHP domain protein, partial [Schaalia georgiae F0490]
MHAHSAFTFLDGTCEPDEMVRAAHSLGLEALAVLDVDGMHSAVRTTMAAREAGLPIVHGSELTIDASSLRPVLPGAGGRGWGLRPGAHDPGVRLPVLAASPQGYSALVSAMSDHALSRPGRRDSCHRLGDLSGRARDWLVLTGSGRGPLRRALRSHGTAGARRVLDSLVELFGRDAVVVEV